MKKLKKIDASVVVLAKAVDSAIFQCMMNAWNNKEDADRWFKQADKLDSNFKNDYGVHYTELSNPRIKVPTK